MGNYNSTRWKNHIKKTLVEHCDVLDISAWKKVLRPYIYESGTYTWAYGSGTFKVNTQDLRYPWIVFSYVLHDSRVRTEEPIVCAVYLQTTVLHYGGKKWWFSCPLLLGNSPCHRRIAKLYRPPGAKFFGCRQCYDLTYRSSQENHVNDKYAEYEQEWKAALEEGEKSLAPRLDAIREDLFLGRPPFDKI